MTHATSDTFLSVSVLFTLPSIVSLSAACELIVRARERNTFIFFPLFCITLRTQSLVAL